MTPYFYEAEFNNVYIEISKHALHEFIKKMMEEQLSLFWRYEEEKIFLIIDSDDAIHEIPFERNEEFLTLNIDHLTVNDEVIGEAIEVIISQFSGDGVVKKFTGGPLYITSYKTGDIQSIIEIDGSEKIIMNKHGSIIEYKEYDHNLEPKTIFNIMNMEIDYELMELHEAIHANDEQAVRSHKRRLRKLLHRREEVKQLI
ncbi:hypothetical protein [Desertibacillus haloalkaliphilus]|uniref:hypothetical protein n=1 Tax=Desertibacillus haloalkaliphilus TaxID=1328930 RepID=UPI001C271A64|nr:hypothetical protein [Desertibacillus haloalkaliphilus]MBU8908354.1 hypothetical protein [Desertibacillus haloalkaliphilus]